MKNGKSKTRIIDADGHVRETDEEIIEYMSAGYRIRRDAMLYFPLTPHHGWHRSIPANDFRRQDFRVPDWREWAGKLDEGGFELTVLYPTRFMHIGQIGNPPYAVELCRAYNDYLHDKFLTHDRRFRGMALLPLQDPAAAVKELRRAVKKYGMLGGISARRRPAVAVGPRQYWPVYQEADHLGCALSIHSCNSLRDNDRYLVPNEAAALTHVIPQMRQFNNIMFSGVMNKLKNLAARLSRSGLRLGGVLDEQDRGTLGARRAQGTSGTAKRIAHRASSSIFNAAKRSQPNAMSSCSATIACCGPPTSPTKPPAPICASS